MMLKRCLRSGRAPDDPRDPDGAAGAAERRAMILLISGQNRHGDDPHFGQFLCPRSRNRITAPRWAADNAAFSKFDADAYRRMVALILAIPASVPHRRPIFVTVPDVVGDAHRTRHLFAEWYSMELRGLGLPLAYVLQDGERADFVPWPLIVAVFVGGSTAFKVGAEARALVASAQARGKWVHMGRVNTVRRLMYAQQIGCDSVDGSGFARFPDAMLPRFRRVADNGQLALTS